MNILKNKNGEIRDLIFNDEINANENQVEIIQKENLIDYNIKYQL